MLCEDHDGGDHTVYFIQGRLNGRPFQFSPSLIHLRVIFIVSGLFLFFFFLFRRVQTLKYEY
ncbi:hypothetical protein BDV26DRAFT_264497 [Aspergillus bertholletiae]|uniref:Transmembrane protein n=1 Tax=Aspergillus bertholletiae TaxID=1226010 RepID=A0A5N7B6A4_9EURO|nr:hypothetical protein BDV26DRAFT_264497 [Aspergillus bertholletiae]